MGNNFERGQDPKKALKIGVEYYKQKKIEAVKNQKFEEAANWRDKEKKCLENMEEKYRIIKETKKYLFEQIKVANEGLKEIRERCDHPEEYIETVDYMWAPGHISHDTNMCGICGEVITGEYIVENNDPFEGEFPHPGQ